MAEIVTLQIPEALYQRLTIAQQNMKRSINSTTKLKSFIL